MYCPNCGQTVNKKLKYCNNCGERLSKETEIDKDGTPGKMLDNILTTLFLVVMFGLGILVGLVAVLLDKDVDPRFVMIIAIVYLGAVFGICFTLATQVPKLIDAKLKGWNTTDEMKPAQIEPQSAAQLAEYREPVMSVIDHTTKTLYKTPLKEG